MRLEKQHQRPLTSSVELELAPCHGGTQADSENLGSVKNTGELGDYEARW